MTTYTAISGTETQSGKPLTESLLTRLANNLLGVAENDPTAPAFIGRVEIFAQAERTNTDTGPSKTLTITVNNTTGAAMTVMCFCMARVDVNLVSYNILVDDVLADPVAVSIGTGSHDIKFQISVPNLTPSYTIRGTVVGVRA